MTFPILPRYPKLTWLEQGKKPDELIVQGLETIVPNARKLTPEQWLEVKKNFEFDGFPLYQLGFWNLLLRVVSMEVYNLEVQSGGYDRTLGNWNAADALP